MLQFMRHIDRRRFRPLTYVIASTDTSSAVRVKALEDSMGNGSNCRYVSVPRSREVGQSYLSSIATTLVATLHSAVVVYNNQPEMIICNGPGTCLPLVISAFLFNVTLFRRCRTVFVESFCRVDSLSLTGRLVRPLTNRFIVQWPQLTHTYRDTEFIGRMC